MVTCPEVEPPDHGRVEDYDIMYGSTITYSCDPGHQFDDMLQYSTSTCIVMDNGLQYLQYVLVCSTGICLSQ